MQVVEMPIKDIIPYENNAKKHDTTQINNIVQSILDFGFVQPVVVDEHNNLIIGHGRTEAAKKLKLKVIPAVKLEGLTEEEVNKLRLLDNKLNESEWDLLALEKELAELDFSDFDVDFDLPEVDVQKEIQAITEDEVPEVNEEEPPKAKRGDIYQLGNHRLMCGDSTSAEDVDLLMYGAKADMVFTDPPYGYNYQSNMRTESKKFDVIENDDKILDFFPNLVHVASGFVMICTTWKVLDKWIPLFEKYYNLSNMIIWDKGGGGIGDLKHTFLTDYEVILCANNGQEIKKKRIGSVWSIKKDNGNDYVHPTQKPVELSATAITHTTEIKDNVLDVFGGSGSTLIACEQTDRNCYMMELDPKYIDVIIRRWENLTGKQAVKLN